MATVQLGAAIQRGTLASRPASGDATKAGQLYFATDTGLFYHDNGTSWVAVHPDIIQSIAVLAVNGLIARTAADTVAARTLTAGSSKLSVTNGNGVSGNPTVDIGTLTSGDIPNNAADTTGKSAKTDALNSATTVVNVAAATAPSAGQVLTATDSTHATWQNNPAGFADPTTTKGDLIVHAASTTRLPVGTDGQVLTADSAQAEGVKWATTSGGGGGIGTGYIVIVDSKASGTEGGTFTSGAWQTRDLNTEKADTGNHASVASNQITLAAGTYRVYISCPAIRVDRHAARLQDITNGVTLLSGTGEFTESSTSFTNKAQTHSVITGRITLATSTVLEVQHRCTTTQGSGFGLAAGTSFAVAEEIYTVVEMWRE